MLIQVSNIQSSTINQNSLETMLVAAVTAALANYNVKADVKLIDLDDAIKDYLSSAK